MSEWPPNRTPTQKEEVPETVEVEQVSRTHNEHVDTHTESAEVFQAANEDFEHEAQLLEKGATDQYMEIAAHIRAAGVEPNDIKDAWGPAYSLLTRMRGAAHSYGTAKTSADRKKLLKLYNKLENELLTDIAPKTKAATEAWLENHEPKEVSPDAGLEELGDLEHVETPSEIVTEPEVQETDGPSPDTSNGVKGIDSDADEPITMLNPALNKLFEGKQKKPKARTPRVKPLVFSEPEPWMTTYKGGTDSIPETHAEQKAALRRSVEEIQKDLDTKQAILKAFYANAAKTEGIKETKRFQEHNGGKVEDSLEKKIVDTEAEVIKLEKERAEAAAAPHMETAVAAAEIASDVVADQSEQEVNDSNVFELADARDARMKARQQSIVKKHGKGMVGALGALVVSFFGFSSTEKSTAAENAENTARFTSTGAVQEQKAEGERILAGGKPKPVVIPSSRKTRVTQSEVDTPEIDRTSDIELINREQLKVDRPLEEHGLPVGTDARISDFLKEIKERDARPTVLTSVSESTVSDGAPELKSGPESVSDLAEMNVGILDEKKVYTNRHGETIDLSVPKQYAWRMPGSKETFPVVDGGTQEEREAWADEFLNNNPGFEYILVPTRNQVSGEVELRMRTREKNVSSGLVGPVWLKNTGSELPVPSPEDYVRRPGT
ncbi:MAG: hypothetical protein AB202_00305 [Parcubacteria bacterium C7867-007]|nr:MAG: hypothetical protein AB202_00305 [Parcubacteria bacterium C7867-007]